MSQHEHNSRLLGELHGTFLNAHPAAVQRITPEVYAALERQFPAPVCTVQTTDIMAGYQLGVQAVLKAIRDDIVVNA